MALRVANENNSGNLRARVVKLRKELADTTQAYRLAVSRHDSQNAIPLLRTRSRLMRQLLDTQCELLLSLKSDISPPTEESAASSTIEEEERVVA